MRNHLTGWLRRATGSPVRLAVAPFVGALALGPGPFSVTFRIAGQVLGPIAATEAVIPSVAPATASGAGAADHLARPASEDIWITLPPSPATTRLAALARRRANDSAARGTCEIVLGANDPAQPAARRYEIAGCYVKRVETVGADRRVTLGFTTITRPATGT